MEALQSYLEIAAVRDVVVATRIAFGVAWNISPWFGADTLLHLKSIAAAEQRTRWNTVEPWE